MRRLISIIVLAAALVLGYAGVNGTRDGKRDLESMPSVAPAKLAPAPAASARVPAQSFRCDGRQHCSQMRSYEEALYFLQNCPGVKMDGDGDGDPCEQQF